MAFFDRICSVVGNFIWSGNVAKNGTWFTKNISRKCDMLVGFQDLWRDLDTVQNYSKRVPVCCLPLQDGNDGSVNFSARSMSCNVTGKLGIRFPWMTDFKSAVIG